MLTDMSLRQSYRYFRQPRFILSTIIGLCFLALSTGLNYAAGSYAYQVMSNGVTDLILDQLPLYDVSLVFINGAVLMAIVALTLTVLQPKYLPFISKAVAVLYFFRAIALTLTHLGPPADVENLYLASSITERFIFGADYFFSGHTALPLIFAFTFWSNKFARYFFLVCVPVFGVTALLGHVHYSIDVFAAPFIAHSSFLISQKLFKSDWNYISSNVAPGPGNKLSA